MLSASGGLTGFPTDPVAGYDEIQYLATKKPGLLYKRIKP